MEQRGYPNLLWMECRLHVIMAIIMNRAGNMHKTLHSCISVTYRVKFNEQNNSISTGPLYVQTKFEAISTLLHKDVVVLNPMGPCNVGTMLVQDCKILFHIGKWCSMMC